ncbi:hypothetical protein POJ06DRAFT_142924 [Lipomyces tetrasporus]|uniref:Telomerase reverse transcriptase n=1 Tax=Lipomyces tetrasporus TaxID=54092 RepID=A0AAD7VQD6_9ASCO|nr:uncharacterized protein POJ06DRAFT_142924 [Lipomyces tetrasporus]KAJ8098827.1 hypothetical protein POJ06DRAFT_142924 [Lipomyces tetrasporus]
MMMLIRCSHIPILFNKLYGDSVLNSRITILINIHRTFIDVAMRYAYYVRQLSKLGTRLSWLCMKDTIEQIIDCLLSHARRLGSNVAWADVHGLGYAAFIMVLRRKQSNFRDILPWLESMQQKLRHSVREMVAKIAMDKQGRHIIAVKKY